MVSGLATTLKTKTVKLIYMYTDPIADYLTRIRNAANAGHRVVEIPASNLKKEMTKIALKYDRITKQPIIRNLQRISKPGLRKYANASDMPRVLNGLGIAIVSTSKGVMTNKKARQENIGGEILCHVY